MICWITFCPTRRLLDVGVWWPPEELADHHHHHLSRASTNLLWPLLTLSCSHTAHPYLPHLVWLRILDWLYLSIGFPSASLQLLVLLVWSLTFWVSLFLRQLTQKSKDAKLRKLSRPHSTFDTCRYSQRAGAQCIRMGVMEDNFDFDHILHFF